MALYLYTTGTRRPCKCKQRTHSTILPIPNKLVPSAIKNSASSTFLQLPGEIRNRIYHFVLSRPLTKLYRNAMGVRTGRMDLRLLRVCRQIYTDTAALPYTCTTFSFRSGHELASWYLRRKPGQLTVIREIQVRGVKFLAQLTPDGRKLREAGRSIYTKEGPVLASGAAGYLVELLDKQLGRGREDQGLVVEVDRADSRAR